MYEWLRPSRLFVMDSFLPNVQIGRICDSFRIVYPDLFRLMVHFAQELMLYTLLDLKSCVVRHGCLEPFSLATNDHLDLLCGSNQRRGCKFLHIQIRSSPYSFYTHFCSCGNNGLPQFRIEREKIVQTKKRLNIQGLPK